MALDATWFSEICAEAGTAFSLQQSEKLVEEQTPFQKIEIYQTSGFGRLMVIDGFIMLSDRDNFLYHEMMSHPALYSHAAPKRVLIIGGGDCGTLREVLKHPDIESCVQVEIDERVTRLSEEYFPALCTANQDPRADFKFVDGIQWVKDAEAGSYDVIIVDSTDPIGPAEGLFTEAFYRECHRALGQGGILVQQSESPLLHANTIIGPMHEAMSAAGFNVTRSAYFPQCVYPSGWWSATMAQRDVEQFSFREQDARNKPFTSEYYNADIHIGAMAQPEFMRRKLGLSG